MNKSILITGCSSGIGKSLAREFFEAGFQVFAGMRNPDKADPEFFNLMSVVKLDVNSPADITAALAQIESQSGGLDILINNAGYGAMGPLLEMPLSAVRRQFETNVFAPLALIQAAATLLRKRRGLVVNIGSVSGVLPTPFSGAYCSTKSALHTMGEVLAMELEPLGVSVMTIQPGAIQSEFGNNAVRELDDVLASDSIYKPLNHKIQERAMASQRSSTTSDEFARKSRRAILQRRPALTRRFGQGSFIMPLMARLLPERVTLNIRQKLFGLKAITL